MTTASTTVVMDIVVPLAIFLALTVALGFLINKYTPLMGFRGTALCLGLVVTGGLFVLTFNEPLLQVLGPHARKEAPMFRLLAALTGLVVFFVGALLFEKYYSRLEDRLLERQRAIAAQLQIPSAVDIANELDKRMAAREPQRTPQVSVAAPVTAATTPATSGSAEARKKKIGKVFERLNAASGVVDALEYRFRDVKPADWTASRVKDFERQIDDVRVPLGKFLDAELPGTGASTPLRVVGETGRGPIWYEYTRLLSLRDGIHKLLGSIEVYVDRVS